MKPYIGVTGFTDGASIDALAMAFSGYDSHVFMTGVLMNDDTLAGRPSRRYPERYPKAEDIYHILTPRGPEVFHCVHFNTSKPELLHDQLVQVAGIAGPNLQGFQLNMRWPDPAKIAEFHESTFYQYRIILQIGRAALELVDYNAPALVDRLKSYREVIHDVLIDASGGKGELLKLDRTLGLLNAIADWEPNLGRGFAGGLSGETTTELDLLFAAHPGASCDAEGKLMGADGRLDLDFCAAYIDEAGHQIATASLRSVGALN